MAIPITVIWDFDGTLLPSTPYDSEQTLMRARCDLRAASRPLVDRGVAFLVVEADRREWFRTPRRRRLYLAMYPWLLRGAPSDFVDRIARDLADKILPSSRQAIAGLKDAGHLMAVVSCGTADLSKRVLREAGIGACFEWIAGNRFRYRSGNIAGMDTPMLTAEDKLRVVRKAGIDPARCAVVGDGYTDLPLLDRAGTAVLMDPGGDKRHRFAGKGYRFAATVSEAAAAIMKTLST